jgi:hypothetical protein
MIVGCRNATKWSNELHIGRRRFRKFHYIGRYAPSKADD